METTRPDKLLLFSIDALRFAVDTAEVESVIAAPDRLTRTPGSGGARPGIFHHAGHIHQLVELAAQLELTPAEGGRLLLYRDMRDGHWAFHVDHIDALTDAAAGRWTPLPPDLPRRVFPAGFDWHNHIYLYTSFARLLLLRDHGPLRAHLTALRRAETPAAPDSTTQAPPAGDTRPTETRVSPAPRVRPVVPESQSGKEELSRPASRPVSEWKKGAPAPAVAAKPISAPASATTGIRTAKPSATTPFPRSTRTTAPVPTQPAKDPRPAPTARPTLPSMAERPSVPGPRPSVPTRPMGDTPAAPAPSVIAPEPGNGGLMLAFILLSLLLVGASLLWWQPWQAEPVPPRTRVAPAVAAAPAPPLAAAPGQPSVTPEPAPPVVAAPEQPSITPEPAPPVVAAPRQTVVTPESAPLPVTAPEMMRTPEQQTLVPSAPREMLVFVPRDALRPELARAMEGEAETRTDAAEPASVLETPEDGSGEAPLVESVAVSAPARLQTDTDAHATAHASAQTPETSAPEPATAPEAASARAEAAPAPESEPQAPIVVTGAAAKSPVVSDTKPCPRCRLEYVVVHGDTLWAIANRYLRDPWRFHELAVASGITDPDRIWPGDRVIIQVR